MNGYPATILHTPQLFMGDFMDVIWIIVSALVGIAELFTAYDASKAGKHFLSIMYAALGGALFALAPIQIFLLTTITT